MTACERLQDALLDDLLSRQLANRGVDDYDHDATAMLYLLPRARCDEYDARFIRQLIRESARMTAATNGAPQTDPSVARRYLVNWLLEEIGVQADVSEQPLPAGWRTVAAERLGCRLDDLAEVDAAASRLPVTDWFGC